MSRMRVALAAGLALAVLAFFVFDLGRFLSLDFFLAQRHAIEAYRAAHPVRLATAFFALYVLVTGLSVPGAAVLTLVGGAVFGLLWGTLITSLAATAGATLAFLIARFLLHGWVQTRFGKRLEAINEGVRRDGALYLFTLRLVPIFPFFAINLAMALTPIRTWTFFWVSQVGMLPGTIVYVNAGTQIGRVDTLGEIVSPAVLGSFVLLGIFPLLARRIAELVKARKVYAGWRKPARFDRNLVVIGAGSAGLVAAYIAAALKARVTLIERERMGGDCLNTGCVPSKALIRSAREAARAKRAAELGLRVGPVEVDFKAVMERVQRVIAAIEPHDSVQRYTGLGVDVVQGSATITSPWTVEIDAREGTRTLSTRAIVIAAGARPAVPPIPGLEDMDYLTSDTVWALRELPRRLLVLGGGPIGAELAQAFARLGARVSLVEMLPRILAREDAEVSKLVSERFAAEGIEILTGHEARRFEFDQDERILVASHGGREVRVAFDSVLVAVGRQANLEGYGLQDLQIPAARTVETNAFLQTRYPNIYAAGDVAGPYQFTHVAGHQAWYAAVNALFAPWKRFRADYSVVPQVTFVEPEVARVGLNESEARERDVPCEVAVYPLHALDRAIADGDTEGFVKVLTVPGRDRLLGVTIVGAHAGELIAEYVLAMRAGIGLNRILGTIHAYPTLAEANKHAAGAWRRAHTPQRLLAWLERYHGWRRG